MDIEAFTSNLNEFFTQIWDGFIGIAPNLLLALLTFGIGYFIARICQSLLRRFLQNLDRLFTSSRMRIEFRKVNLDRMAGFLGKAVFWIILVLSLTLATQILGLPVVTTWLNGLVQYLPDILIALAIIFLGIIGSTLLRDLITTASGKAGLVYGTVLGRITQYGLLFITIMIAADQVGVNIGFMTEVIDILLAAVLFGAALAFGLGARTSVSNILGSYYLQSRYKVGQTIRIAGTEGRIIQITPTMVIIESGEGQITIPAKKFNELISKLIIKEGS